MTARARRRWPTRAELTEFTRRLVRAQWPILSVAVIFVIAFALVAAGFWRRGSLLIGIAVGLAAVLRLVLSDERAGLLVVRSKSLDFATMVTVCAVMVYRLDDRPAGHQLGDTPLCPATSDFGSSVAPIRKSRSKAGHGPPAPGDTWPASPGCTP